MSGWGSKSRSKGGSRDLRNSVLAGALVALFVVLLGGYFTFTSSPRWSAEASVIVLPLPDLEPAQETAYYEYLSRGQIVATFAELGNNAGFVEAAQDEVGMNEEDRAQSDIALSVVPSTSVVVATATAPNADQAVALANVTLKLASTYLTQLDVPFRAQAVAPATSASPAGPSKALILSATLVAALVSGLATQQITHAFLRSRTGRGEPSAGQAANGEEPSQARPAGK